MLLNTANAASIFLSMCFLASSYLHRLTVNITTNQKRSRALIMVKQIVRFKFLEIVMLSCSVSFHYFEVSLKVNMLLLV